MIDLTHKRVNISRCVDDGYCSMEQANMIQKYLERRLQQLYTIDQTIGKSLYVANAEVADDQSQTKKQPIISDDDDTIDDGPTHASSTTITRPTDQSESTVTMPTATPSSPNKGDDTEPNDSLASPSNHRTSPASIDHTTTKEEASPIDMPKARSPSSLSEASPSQN
jgi:hypothetical protein